MLVHFFPVPFRLFLHHHCMVGCHQLPAHLSVHSLIINPLDLIFLSILSDLTIGSLLLIPRELFSLSLIILIFHQLQIPQVSLFLQLLSLLLLLNELTLLIIPVPLHQLLLLFVVHQFLLLLSLSMESDLVLKLLPDRLLLLSHILFLRVSHPFSFVCLELHNRIPLVILPISSEQIDLTDIRLLLRDLFL